MDTGYHQMDTGYHQMDTGYHQMDTGYHQMDYESVKKVQTCNFLNTTKRLALHAIVEMFTIFEVLWHFVED